MGNISSSTDRKSAPASQAGGLSARFKRFFSRSTTSPETRAPNGRRVAIAPADVAPVRQAARTTSATSTHPKPLTQRHATSPSRLSQSSSSAHQAILFPLPGPGDVLLDGFEVPPPPPRPKARAQGSSPARTHSTPPRITERAQDSHSLDSSPERTPARPAPKMKTVASRERKSKPGLEMTPPLPLQVLSPPQTPAVPASPVLALPVPDDSLTPEQAIEWVVATARQSGGARASDADLSFLWIGIESYAQVWTPLDLQVLGQALGNIFKLPSGIGALSQDLRHTGLERLMRECFLDKEPVLLAVQLGALFGGIRRCLRPDRPGADNGFLRIISLAVQGQVPIDHCVAMACGFYRAIRTSAHQVYEPSTLTIGVPKSHQESVLETLNWGKRLALDPLSFYEKGVCVVPGKRYPWLMMAYEMPGVPVSVPGAPRSGASLLQRAASTMSPAQKREFLTVFKSARALPGVERKGQ